jgi:hypothetical protein
MYIRGLIIAAWLCALPSGFALAGEPVVKGSFRTIVFLGQHCLTAPKTEPHLRPGIRLEMRDCDNSPEQIFEWNVVTFEIKFGDLCMDAFHDGKGPSQPGDPVGLWYCQQTPHQKWYPDHKDESWLEAFNIVGGGSPSSELCLSIAGGKDVDGAQLTIQACDNSDQQWLRLRSWPPPRRQKLSQDSNSSVPETPPRPMPPR